MSDELPVHPLETGAGLIIVGLMAAVMVTFCLWSVWVLSGQSGQDESGYAVESEER